VELWDKPRLPDAEEARSLLGVGAFDYVFAREPWRGTGDPFAMFAEFSKNADSLLDKNGHIVLIFTPPYLGMRISALAPESGLLSAENEFFAPADGAAQRWQWTERDVEDAFKSAGFFVKIDRFRREEERVLSPREVEAWFSEKSPWGAFMLLHAGKENCENAKRELAAAGAAGGVPWNRTVIRFEAQKH
jgi:putative ATPase